MKIDYSALTTDQAMVARYAFYEYSSTGALATDTYIKLRKTGLDPDTLISQFEHHLNPVTN